MQKFYVMQHLFEDKFKPTLGYNLTQPINSKGEVDISGNGARYTPESIIALKNNNALTKEAIDIYKKGFEDLELLPGLLMRTPVNGFGQQSVDDTVGAITADKEINTGFSKRWLKYGRSRGANVYGEDRKGKLASFTIPLIKKKVVITYEWLSPKLFKILKFFGRGMAKGVYNNERPYTWRLSALLWRQYQIVTHAKIVAKEKLTLFNKLVWCFAVYRSRNADPHNSDAWMLSFHLVRTAREVRSSLMQRVRKVWIKKFKEVHPEGAKGALEQYGWAHHPNATYLKNEFGE